MENIKQKLLEQYPFLKNEPPAIINDLFSQSNLQTIPSDYQFVTENDTCTGLAFILEGSARVFKMGETGREITLYHVDSGEICLLTAISILNNKEMSANAITETDVKGFIVDSRFIKYWIDESSSFRTFIFELISNRFGELVELIDAITFQKVDQRIIDFLKSHNTNEVEITHQEIAKEIGSSREVISRILKDFERRNLIERSRNKIKLISL